MNEHIATSSNAHRFPNAFLWSWRQCPLTCLLFLAACARSLDMSGERIEAPGVEWGVVVGSVLIEAERAERPSGAQAVEGETFVFDVVQIQPGDPEGTRPYAQEYELTVQGGKEKLFVSRLRPGRYLIRSFHASGLVGLGGELHAVFTAEPGAVRYVGRLHVVIPSRLSKDRPYRFTLENAHKEDLATLAVRHPALAGAAREAPMELRPPSP